MTHDFSLDRKATIVLISGSAVLVVLVFFAGFLTGMSWQPDTRLLASRRAPVAEAAAAAPPVPAGAKPEASKTEAAKPEAASVESKPASTPAPPPPAPEPAKATTPAEAAPAPAPMVASASRSTDQGGVRLAVQVGSFLEKTNAQKLAEHLKDAGYSPEIVLSGSADKHWNVVRVGPYQDWDEAYQIAALLSRDQTSPAVIRPIR